MTRHFVSPLRADRALRASWRTALCLLAPSLSCGGGDPGAAPPDAALVDAAQSTSDGAQATDDAAQVPDAGDDAGADDAGADDAGGVDNAPEASAGCSGNSGAYPAGTTTVGELNHAAARRTFRVHVPPGYTGATPLPLVLMLHGGGGSGRQFEEASSGMDPVADREGFIAVYPDGSGLIKTWNGGGCCGSAVENDVDDVGFMASLLDHLEGTLCVDRRRLFASGMSNGGILSHRLGCELAGRLAAVAPVAGTDMTATCAPARPIPVLHIHGSDDGHVPWLGGEGCGPAGVSFTSVPATLESWRTRNACLATTSLYYEQGDGRCEAYTGCGQGVDVVLCRVAGGGHNWPGGEPPAGLVECPGNGGQSSSFVASEVIWSFFATHPRPR